MAINEADLTQYMERTEKRISALEDDVRRISKNEGRWQNTSHIYPLSANLSNIREMLLLEIVRESGLLERVDLDKISKKVRMHLVDAKSIPWAGPSEPGQSSAQQLAARNFETALAEIKDLYEPDEDNREE